MTIPADSSPPGEYYCPACEKHFQLAGACPNDGSKLVRLGGRIDPYLGRELDGRYTILEKLGQGGMGAVYRSAQHSVDREVAVKVISSHLVADPDVIKRFLREAKLASKLTHPNAVGVLDFGQTDDGLFYLVMELCIGRTLDVVFKAEGVFKPERVVRIGTQVCDALEGAHALQIVHRDLKPSNIMLLSQGRDLVKVLDFGLAKSVAPDQAQTTMTNAGALLGTPAFMPPELALGQPCDGRADLYSLGCVLYLLGSGRLPFVAETAHELIAAHGLEQAPPVTGVPPALGSVIDRLLEKDPEERFPTAAEARDALEGALDGRFVSLPAITITPRPGHQAAVARLASDETAVAPSLILHRRRRRWPYLVATVALAAGGLGYYRLGMPTELEPAPVAPVGSAPLPQPDPTPARVSEPPPPAHPTESMTVTPPALGSADPVVPPPPAAPIKRTKRQQAPIRHTTPATPAQVEHASPPDKPPTDKPPPQQQGTGSGSGKKAALPF